MSQPSFGSAFISAQRKPIAIRPAQPVTIGKTGPHALPVLVQANEPLELSEWAKANSEEVAKLFRTSRALLFRGFRMDSPERFKAAAAATSHGDFLEYIDRSTPRTTVGTGVYVSTIYPNEETIRLHNEGTYWLKWPMKIYFCCLVPSEQGGQTPIADVRRVYSRISPAVRERFAQREVMYVRNYNDGLGLPWQETFQTTDPAQVEAYCRENRIAFEWKEGNRLKTRQIRPAVRIHPLTGEPVWFNHAAFFHVSSLEPMVRETLLKSYDESELPYNTYYGDGSPIEPDAVEEIRQAYEAEKIMFDWQRGDVLMLDNMSIAHARQPYTGKRQVIVAMVEPCSGE